jgi:GMP synthase-like glutamine amidotransferase
LRALAVIHGTNARGGVFAETVRDHGHAYDEWSLAWGTPPPRPLEDYGAVLVFGGSMHADQDEQHPWLVEENAFIQRLLADRTPMLGVCLGIQLMAKAEGAAVHALPGGPEIGWFPVELTEAAAEDPIFSQLPAGFEAFGWHYYTYDVPARAEELARSARCNQAYRLGDNAWGVQFHPEVTLEITRAWLADEDDFPHDLDRDAFAAEIEEKLPAWNELGRTLCGSFLAVAESAGAGEPVRERAHVPS